MVKEHKGIFARFNKLWMKIKTPNGWRNLKTPYSVGQEDEAAEYREAVQRKLDAGQEYQPDEIGTVKAYGDRWLKWRSGELDAAGYRVAHPVPLVASWADDLSRMKTWIYPEIGSLRMDQVRAYHVAKLVAKMREAGLAPRTVRNVYSVCKAMFRDAMIQLPEDGITIRQDPCVLTKFQLGKIKDKKAEWRAGAIFTRSELEELISNPRVPWDRRILYSLLGMGALRHGEAAALRWRHYVTGLQPLSRLVIANSNNSESTKTGVERWMPVPSVLAAMLAEWKLSGWEVAFGHKPEPDDLIVPHTKPTNRGPRVKWGGMRTDHDSYKRLKIDCDALQLRHRRIHDFRRTGITLYREDGADRDILRLCTHGRSLDIMESYTSFGWAKLCAQIQSLKLQRNTTHGKEVTR